MNKVQRAIYEYNEAHNPTKPLYLSGKNQLCWMIPGKTLRGSSFEFICTFTTTNQALKAIKNL